MALTSAHVSALSNWVYAGGNLIALRPDRQLAGLLGLSDVGSTLSEGYLLVNRSNGPGGGDCRGDDAIPRDGRPIHAGERIRRGAALFERGDWDGQPGGEQAERRHERWADGSFHL